jgi:hypothetical protein
MKTLLQQEIEVTKLTLEVCSYYGLNDEEAYYKYLLSDQKLKALLEIRDNNDVENFPAYFEKAEDFENEVIDAEIVNEWDDDWLSAIMF